MEYIVGPKDILTKEFLYEEFVVKQKGIHTIAKENGIKSTNSVTQFLNKFKISRPNIRNVSAILTKEFLIEHYIENNKSLKEIAKIIGIKNRSSVKTALKKHNIPLRLHTRSESYVNSMMERRIYKEISGHYWSSIQHCAKRRNIEFNITLEYIWNLYIEQNRKCKLSGVDIKFNDICNDNTTQTASLDRRDSSIGYIEGNVQWVHKTINRIKWHLNQDEFLDWCDKVSNNTRK
jgi:predicted DNA-binding protein YlxM (UPF0122 family)